MINDEFKKYFKFPLIFKPDFPYVLANDGEMALTWAIEPDCFCNPSEIINKINGYSNKSFEKEWTIKDKTFIYYGDTKVFLVRGYWMLTNHKYNLDPLTACKIQDNFAKEIITNLNK